MATCHFENVHLLAEKSGIAWDTGNILKHIFKKKHIHIKAHFLYNKNLYILKML